MSTEGEHPAALALYRGIGRWANGLGALVFGAGVVVFAVLALTDEVGERQDDVALLVASAAFCALSVWGFFFGRLSTIGRSSPPPGLVGAFHDAATAEAGGHVRPVVPQDRAAAAARGVLAVVASLVALQVWDHPVLGPVLVMVVVVLFGAGSRFEPFSTAQVWRDDLGKVPRAAGVIGSSEQAARTGLALGGAGGLALLLSVVASVAWFGTASWAFALLSIVLSRAIGRLQAVRLITRWEHQQGVVLCRRPAATRVVLLHETDLERIVAVPRER